MRKHRFVDEIAGPPIRFWGWCPKFEQLSDPQSPTTLYRAMDGTLYSGGYQYPARSTDNGSTWEQVNKGLSYSWYMGICGDGDPHRRGRECTDGSCT